MTYNAQHLSRTSWNRVSDIIKRRDDKVCQYCLSDAPSGEPDHILPLSQGGTDSLCNLVWSCQKCNREKQGKSVREWFLHVQGLFMIQACQKCKTKNNLPVMPGNNGPAITVKRFTSKTEQAKKWLTALLQGTPGNSLLVSTILENGSRKGFTQSLLNRVKQEINSRYNGLKIESIKDGSIWRWVLHEDKSFNPCISPSHPDNRKVSQ